MPKRHRKSFNFKETAGLTQHSCSSIFPQNVRRASPALPGRLPQVEEAELFLGVTKASAEPDTGAIHFGPSPNTSKPVGLSLQMEAEVGTSRIVGMGRLSDGFSRPSSTFNNPLRNSNNILELPPPSTPSLQGTY